MLSEKNMGFLYLSEANASRWFIDVSCFSVSIHPCGLWCLYCDCVTVISGNYNISSLNSPNKGLSKITITVATHGTTLGLLMHCPSEQSHKQVRNPQTSGKCNITWVSITCDDLTWNALYGIGIYMMLHTGFPMFVDFCVCLWDYYEWQCVSKWRKVPGVLLRYFCTSVGLLCQFTIVVCACDHHIGRDWAFWMIAALFVQ